MRTRAAGRTREDWLESAREYAVFSAVAPQALPALRDLAVCHDYPKNNVLYYQGDASRAVFLVLAGEVKISLTNEEGREAVVRLVRQGGLVGLVAAVDGAPQPATAVTVTRSRLARFAAPDLIALVASHPAAHAALLREVAGCARQAYQRVGEHALLSVKERLLSALLEIAEQEGERHSTGQAVVFTRPTHQELAERIGSSREVVSRVLKELLDDEGKVIQVPLSALVLRDD
jgi:CRP-like cAMP-binding protein